MNNGTLSVFLLCLFASVLAARGEISVSSDFEGGSVEVQSINHETQELSILPADHPGKGWRCWWYFRVDGLRKNSVLSLKVGPAPWATAWQAHFSRDSGKTWQQTEKGVKEEKAIKYRIASGEDESLLVAWGPPFTPSDAEKLVAEIAGKYAFVDQFNLAVTRENRETPALRIAPGKDKAMVWIQARQHAWESGSSWVAKGLIEFIVSDDPRAVDLRNRVEVIVVPIMDIDNTARGAGGKNQIPNDHNRDWSSAPHWNSVAAAQQAILKAKDEGRFKVFVDLHNPGPNDPFPYFYIPPRDQLSQKGRENLERFLKIARKEICGNLRFMGRATESGRKYDAKNWQKISKNWVVENAGNDVVSVTLETAWNSPASTIKNYQEVGRELVLCIERYLRE